MLNGTFLVQAIHFFIAYVIVERLLFRPALREITADRLEKALLQEAVDAQIELVEHLEKTQESFMKSTAHSFAQSQPHVRMTLGGSVPQEIPAIPVLNATQKAHIIDESVASLIKEVEHA